MRLEDLGRETPADGASVFTRGMDATHNARRVRSITNHELQNRVSARTGVLRLEGGHQFEHLERSMPARFDRRNRLRQ